MHPHLCTRDRSLKALVAACFCIVTCVATLPACAADASSASSTPPSAAPIAAMMAVHAASGLLLGVTDTGKHLVAVGGNGDIILSNDGVTWTQVQTPVDVTLTGISFADDQHGWAVGHDALILYTADGGHTWRIQNDQPALNSPMFAVQAISEQKAVAVGAFGLMKMTEDGGKHWADVDAHEVVSDKLHLNNITRLANGDLLVVGENGLAAVSTDGLHWQRLKIPYEGSFFGALPWGSQGAIAYGLRGNIYATEDVHTMPWHQIEVATTSSFFGGLKLPAGGIVIVGGDSAVVRIDQSGTAHLMHSNPDRIGQSSTLAAGVFYKDKLLMTGTSGIVHASLQ
ncbi:MAG: WD40/YVTN/BNR-like repeat-containing protein [Stenotrophobium sp.]